jgi:dimethylaniline monooxygenase (N-oxide forming)
VYVSTRRGTWVYNRVGPDGWPVDMYRTNPIIATIQKCSPWLMNRLIERELGKRFSHELYSLKPNHRPLRMRFIVSSLYVHYNLDIFQQNNIHSLMMIYLIESYVDL